MNLTPKEEKFAYSVMVFLFILLGITTNITPANANYWDNFLGINQETQNKEEISNEKEIKLEGFVYSNTESHYSFLVPSGWIEIPKPIIDKRMHKVADIIGDKYDFVDFSEGFQLNNSSYFKYPYFLVNKYIVDIPYYNYEKVAAMLNNPVIDSGRNLVFEEFENSMTDNLKLKGLTVMFLGEKIITKFSFYSLESEYQEFLPIFNEIINSFKYNQGYEYSIEKANQNLHRSSSIAGLVGGLKGVLLIGLIYLLIKKFTKPKKAKTQ